MRAWESIYTMKNGAYEVGFKLFELDGSTHAYVMQADNALIEILTWPSEPDDRLHQILADWAERQFKLIHGDGGGS